MACLIHPPTGTGACLAESRPLERLGVREFAPFVREDESGQSLEKGLFAVDRYLGGREALGHVLADERHGQFEVVLLFDDPLACRGQKLVGKRLGPRRRVLAIST